MNKFQQIKFQNIDEFLDFLPEAEFTMVNLLRDIIAHTFPKYTEKLAYNVPFYYNPKRICFIWPAAVPWGNITHGVALGFTNGHLLDPEGELLEFDSRKTMGRLIFKDFADIKQRQEHVQFLLQEAYLLNGKRHKK